MSVWVAHALFFCTFSAEACEFVTCEVPDFENATRMIGSRVVLSDKIDFISMCHPLCRTRIHLHPLSCTWAFFLLLLLLSLSLPYLRHLHLTVHVADQLNPAKIHKMKSVALWLIQPLPQMLASPLWKPEREENEGQARAYHSEGKPDAECVQKREANAQRTRAYHSERESLMTSSSRDLVVSGKLDAVFSCHSESSQNTFSERDRSNEPGNRIESSVHSVLNLLTRQILGNLSWWKQESSALFIGEGLKLWNRNIKWNLLTGVSMNFSDKLVLRDWTWRTPITFILNFEENNFALQKNHPWRKKRFEKLRDEIFTRKEKLRERQELRVDKFSVQKLRESHETVQRLTSQMQEVQDQMNSMDDSGEFQEVESNHSGTGGCKQTCAFYAQVCRSSS